MMHKTYIVKSRRMRIFLQDKGLDCRVQQDCNDPTKDIYIFIDSPLFKGLMDEYFKTNQYNKVNHVTDLGT